MNANDDVRGLLAHPPWPPLHKGGGGQACAVGRRSFLKSAVAAGAVDALPGTLTGGRGRGSKPARAATDTSPGESPEPDHDLSDRGLFSCGYL